MHSSKGLHQALNSVAVLCTCGTAPMTAEHLLQTCPTYSNGQKDTWQHPVPLHEKLYGNLELTAARIINVNLTANEEGRPRNRTTTKIATMLFD
jgi:hypothetical protein